jgi:oxalate decarboxylase
LQAEWGFVYAGEVLVSAVDENGDYQVDKLQVGDIWYFPKGSAHTVQGEQHPKRAEFLKIT